MERYIALLRGVNISGKNKVSMPALKEAFEEIGFLDVQTYINSGNVLFSSEEKDVSEINKQCRKVMEEIIKLDVPFVILSVKELADALDHAPQWWDIESNVEIIHQAIFLIPPLTIKEVYQAVGEAKDEYEQVDDHKKVIFFSAPRATLSRSRWYKIASSSVNNQVTIRNAKTAKRLLMLSDESFQSV